jgi:hypothetical protein
VQLHIDNGVEFVNNHFVRCWKEAAKGLYISRSQPYHKNDNRFVEQKNSTLVRAYFGDTRFDTRLQCHKMNQLYDKLWLYNNFFQPVMHLNHKEVLPQGNGMHKVRHRYDSARTPFDRLCATDAISQQTKETLTALRDATNPRQLRRDIYRLLEELWKLVEEAPDQLVQTTQDARGRGIGEEDCVVVKASQIEDSDQTGGRLSLGFEQAL